MSVTISVCNDENDSNMKLLTSGFRSKAVLVKSQIFYLRRKYFLRGGGCELLKGYKVK